MLRWLTRFVLFRLLGGRALAALAIFGFIRRQLAGRRTATVGDGSTSPPRSTSARGSTSKDGSTSRTGSSPGR